MIKSLMAGIYRKKRLLLGVLTITANFFFSIFKKTFYFGMILDLQNRCNHIIKSSRTCSTHLYRMLLSYITTVHLSKLGN